MHISYCKPIKTQTILHHLDKYTDRDRTLLFDSKVDNGGLGGDLGRVVGVTQLSGDVESELWVVLNLFVSQLYHVSSTYKHTNKQILNSEKSSISIEIVPMVGKFSS